MKILLECQSPLTETYCGYNMIECGEDMADEGIGQGKFLCEKLSHLFHKPIPI